MIDPDDTAFEEERTSSSGMASALVTLALFASSLGIAAVEDDGGAGAVAPDAVASPAAVAVLSELVVAPEAAGEDYDREAFNHWVDADKDGCDTRQEVLLLESRAQTTLEPSRCRVATGEWHSMYDGVVVTNPTTLDIDHMVPLKEAWESAASTWTDEQREAYANDLDAPLALLAVTASTNRSKADRDPAEWKPPDRSTWCAYAQAWASVKAKWALTADTGEITALEEMLATC
ncbi:MAG: HNH endonuclease family protein [Actinomycetota bacterium]|nr:HNH endonuclease family protein [Actinomycetota bacterium]